MPNAEQQPQELEGPTQSKSHLSSLMSTGKGSTLAPQLSVSAGNLELKNMSTSETAMAEDHDMMQLARVGDVETMRKLFDDGLFSPDYCDEEDITPLHVRFLGCDVVELC